MVNTDHEVFASHGQIGWCEEKGRVTKSRPLDEYIDLRGLLDPGNKQLVLITSWTGFGGSASISQAISKSSGTQLACFV